VNRRLVCNYFNSSKLETIRWQYHADYDDKGRNAQPKVIVDVSVVEQSNDMFSKVFSIHRPSAKLCRRMDQLDFRQLQQYPITIKVVGNDSFGRMIHGVRMVVTLDSLSCLCRTN
jgi:hypothetical protein